MPSNASFATQTVVNAVVEAAKQDKRLIGLQAEQLARAAKALDGFRTAFAVNLDDITHIELMKMQQGKASQGKSSQVDFT